MHFPAVVLLRFGCHIQQFRCLPTASHWSRLVRYTGTKMGVESRISLSMDKQLKITIVALLCTGVCAATPKKPAEKPVPQKPSAAVPAAATPVAAPVVPQPPPTPENSPAKAPQVSMSNGMLSIVAENSTLGDVLKGIHSATGASVDIPPAA